MNCPRCSSQTEIINELYNFDEDYFSRDILCTFCNSVIIETFYSDSRYKSDWIDLNV